MVLTGGSANLVGVDTLAQEVLGLPARIGVPTGVYGIADVLPDPAYATSVGLLLWGFNKREGEEGWRPQGVGEVFRRLFFRLHKLIAS